MLSRDHKLIINNVVENKDCGPDRNTCGPASRSSDPEHTFLINIGGLKLDWPTSDYE